MAQIDRPFTSTTVVYYSLGLPTYSAIPVHFSEPSSHIALVFQSFCSRTIADRIYYNRIAEKDLVE